MSQLLDHPVPTLPPPPPRKSRVRPRVSRTGVRVAGVVIGVLIVGAIWLFYFSSVFALESLVVEGVRTVPPAEVGQRADLGAGTPLSRVNPEDVEDRVMAIPAVRSVEVMRRWPNTVVIKVSERQRAGYFRAKAQTPAAESGAVDENGNPVTVTEVDKYEILDSTGYAFEFFETLEEVPDGLPEIIAPDVVARNAAAEVGGSLPLKLLDDIVSIKAETPDNIILTTDGQVTVMWGKSDQNEAKARILEALLKVSDGYWIDLRFPQAPTTAYTTPQPNPPAPTPSASSSDDATDESDESTAESTAEPTAESDQADQGSDSSVSSASPASTSPAIP